MKSKRMKSKRLLCESSSHVAARMALLRTGGLGTAGFTLIELLIVAVVLGILAAAIVPSLLGRTEVARRARAEADIATLEMALALFYLDMGRYPDEGEGLRVLYYPPETDAEKWKEPYVTKPIFEDPWDNDYLYRSPGTHSNLPYEITSYGKDGEEGGEGDDADVTSWVDIEGEE